MSLQQGASDLLGISEGNNPTMSLLRDFLLAQGDRVVHFSCEAYEIASTALLPDQSPNTAAAAGGSPGRSRRVPRWVLITDSGFLCVPRTSVETGIFFDCRTSLESLSLVIVGSGGAAEHNNSNSNSAALSPTATTEVDASVFLKSTVPFSEPTLAATLLFDNGALRKTFLLALCIVKPSLPILQRRQVDSGKGSQQQGGRSSNKNDVAARNGSMFRSPTAQQQSVHNTSMTSPNPRAPRGGAASSSSPLPGGEGGDAHKSPYAAYTRGWSASQERQGVMVDRSLGALTSLEYHDPATAPVYDLAADVFALSRDRLHDILHDTLDPSTILGTERSTARPPEEDASRASERESIRAMLDHREKKIIQNIEFRLKYPTKPATRVRPGVEFDKAHEERLTLPDDIPEDELLGPALWSLWSEWKRTGGLLSLPFQNPNSGLLSTHTNNNNSMASPSSTHMGEWSLYLSNELIDSLRAKEDELFGLVGPKCARKLRTMRDLVARERALYKNREPPVLLSSSSVERERSSMSAVTPERGMSLQNANATPRSQTSSSAAKSPSTSKVKPFRLSQSTLTSLHSQVKVLERQQLVHELKTKHDVHVQSKHHLNVDHIKKQISRLSPER